MNPTLAAPLPVTLLSGFLGAGKTTVLNALLNHAHGRRFAVVENEFGAVNIDSQLISRRQGGIIELTNGCVCYTVKADLVRGLQDLAAQRASGRLAFDQPDRATGPGSFRLPSTWPGTLRSGGLQRTVRPSACAGFP